MILLLPINPIPALLLIQLRVRLLLPPTLRPATLTPLSLDIQLNNSNCLIQQMEVSCSSIQLQIHKFILLKLVVAIRPLRRLSRPIIQLKPDSYCNSTQLTQPTPLSPTPLLAILRLPTSEAKLNIHCYCDMKIVHYFTLDAMYSTVEKTNNYYFSIIIVFFDLLVTCVSSRLHLHSLRKCPVYLLHLCISVLEIACIT